MTKRHQHYRSQFQFNRHVSQFRPIGAQCRYPVHNLELFSNCIGMYSREKCEQTMFQKNASQTTQHQRFSQNEFSRAQKNALLQARGFLSHAAHVKMTTTHIVACFWKPRFLQIKKYAIQCHPVVLQGWLL